MANSAKVYYEEKNSPRFVSVEMVAILDFMALPNGDITLKPLVQMQWEVAYFLYVQGNVNNSKLITDLFC